MTSIGRIIIVGTMSAVSPYLGYRWRREMAYRRPIKVVPNISDALPVVAPRTTRAHRLVLDVTDQTDRKNVASLIRAGQRRTAGSPWTLPP